MKKALIFLLSIIALGSITASAKDIDVAVNGELLRFDTPPIIEDGRTLVPFRKIFEALDYEVSWNGEDKSITAERQGTVMRLQIGSADISVNDEAVTSDAAPKLIGSTTYVPVRIISENSDCDVLWSQDSQTVLIYSRQQPYTPCIHGSYSIITTDGSYIYTHDDTNTYRFKEDLTRENLPFGRTNDIAVVGNKFYSRGENFHYQSIDLDTYEVTDLTETDVAGCVIADDNIYYGFFPDPRNENPDKHGIYTMKLDGSDKKQIYPLRLYNYYVKGDIIFSENKIISLTDKSEKTLTDKFITASALDDENYYIAIGEYTNEATPLEPIGVIAYNYKTDEEKFFPFDKEINAIQATTNSIFVNYQKDNSDYSYDNNVLVRFTKNFEYPVVLRDNIYTEIYVFGNHVYFYDTHHPESFLGFSRICTDGSDCINLDAYWSSATHKYVSISYSYPYNDAEKSLIFLSMLTARLNSMGYTDAVIKETDMNNCTVRLDIGDNDPQWLAETLIARGALSFEDPDGVVILTNEDILDVTVKNDEVSLAYGNSGYIEIKLTADAQKKFAYATEYVSAKASENKNYISINLDGSIISAPTVSEKIDRDTLALTGYFTEDSIEALAFILRSGVMPFEASIADITFK